MTLTAFRNLQRWDEYRIFRMQEGRKMRGPHSREEWRTILRSVRTLPSPLSVTVEIEEGRILLHPVEPATQLQLGATVAALTNLRVTNAKDVFDPRLPFRLAGLIGRDAFLNANNWRHRVWPQALELARAGQLYPAGWDGLQRRLGAEPAQAFPAREIAIIARTEISRTLSGQELNDFWIVNR